MSGTSRNAWKIPRISLWAQQHRGETKEVETSGERSDHIMVSRRGGRVGGLLGARHSTSCPTAGDQLAKPGPWMLLYTICAKRHAFKTVNNNFFLKDQRYWKKIQQEMLQTVHNDIFFFFCSAGTQGLVQARQTLCWWATPALNGTSAEWDTGVQDFDILCIVLQSP